MMQKGLFMKTWLNVKKWLSGGCVYFTLIAMLMILLLSATSTNGSQPNINVSAFLLMFPCGLCFSAAGMLMEVKAIARWIRILSHYLIAILAVFLFLILPNFSGRGSTLMVILIFFSALYWMIFGLITLVRNRVRKLLEED